MRFSQRFFWDSSSIFYLDFAVLISRWSFSRDSFRIHWTGQGSLRFFSWNCCELFQVSVSFLGQHLRFAVWHVADTSSGIPFYLQLHWSHKSPNTNPHAIERPTNLQSNKDSKNIDEISAGYLGGCTVNGFVWLQRQIDPISQSSSSRRWIGRRWRHRKESPATTWNDSSLPFNNRLFLSFYCNSRSVSCRVGQ